MINPAIQEWLKDFIFAAINSLRMVGMKCQGKSIFSHEPTVSDTMVSKGITPPRLPVAVVVLEKSGCTASGLPGGMWVLNLRWEKFQGRLVSSQVESGTEKFVSEHLIHSQQCQKSETRTRNLEYSHGLDAKQTKLGNYLIKIPFISEN